MMPRSESIAKLTPALISARGAMPPVTKDQTNPHFKSHYADLAACLEACEPSLAKFGLAVLQTPIWADGCLELVTTLAHISGEWVSSSYPICADITRPQAMGAALTYARRYCYMAIVGRAPEDDDGETASGRGQDTARRETRPVPAPNGNGNGHAPKERTDWNRNRYPDRRSEAIQDGLPARAATANGERPPTTGKALFGWCRRMEEQHGGGLVNALNGWGQQQGYPARIVDWNQRQVADGYAEGQALLDVIYQPDQDETGDGGDDGRHDDEREY
jgi:hypothetical protein